MNTTVQWYAVYTKPKWEKKVAKLLTQKGIQNFCPINKVTKQWHDRKKMIEEPLFTSYVFVQISMAEELEVRKTDGVLNFVYWLGNPAVIKDHEITTIQEFLKEYAEIQLEKTKIKPDDQVQILQGPLMHREGSVLEVCNKTIKVLLPSLGYALVAQVDKAHVEVKKTANIKVQEKENQSFKLTWS